MKNQHKNAVICHPCGEQSLAPQGLCAGGLQGRKGVSNKRHSRMFLSGIFNACRYNKKENSLLDECVKEQPSGMTPLFDDSGCVEDAEQKPLSIQSYNGLGSAHGFTLIELLVVVLIIGILAAIALPQYQKSVKKAQARELFVVVDALDKSLHAYYLEHGSYDGVTVDVFPIQIPALQHFYYEHESFVGGHSITYESLLENSSIKVEYGKKAYVRLKATDNTVITLYWQNGHFDYAACRGVACSDYFVCDWDRRDETLCRNSGSKCTDVCYIQDI